MTQLLAVVAVVGLTACAPRSWPAVVTPDPTPTDGVLRLISARAIGQGCPISETLLLTARHVATVTRVVGPLEPLAVVWSDVNGRTGSAWTIAIDPRRDLALMRSDRPFARWYSLATQAPARDAAVEIVGYDYRDRLGPQITRAKVANVISAHLILFRHGEPGSSGSCVLDGEDRIVGIFVGVVGRADAQHGLAVAVWGEWGDVEWTPPDPD